MDSSKNLIDVEASKSNPHLKENPNCSSLSTSLPIQKESGNSSCLSASLHREFHPGIANENISGEVADKDVIGAETFLFDDQTIRKGFIRKVYSVLMCQLLITVSIISVFVCHEPTRNYFKIHNAYFIGAAIFTVILVIFMACCSDARRKSPMNYICLFTFTLAESFLVGTAVSSIPVEKILIAGGLTVLICFALTVFAFQTKWDFTGLNATLFVALILFTVFGITSIFFYSRILSLLYSVLGVLLFSMYLIYDTQLMVGGKHKYSISPEEYVFSALNLYLDIIRIFLHLISIRL